MALVKAEKTPVEKVDKIPDKSFEGNKTERDPTPAPVKQRISKRGPVAQPTAACEDSKK